MVGRPHCLGDGFGINKVAPVRLYIRLNVLGRNDPNLMALVAEGFASKVRAGTSSHADQIGLKIGSQLQELRARAAFSDGHFAAFIQANEVKHCLAEIDADRM